MWACFPWRRCRVTLRSNIHSWGSGLDHSHVFRKKSSEEDKDPLVDEWGFWNLWWQWGLTSVWLSMSFFRILFRVNFMLYHLHKFSWVVTKWNTLSLFRGHGTSIRIQGPNDSMNCESLRVTESFWKWISEQVSSNLTWCLVDDGTQSPQKNLGNCTLLSGRYVWCVMKFMKWRKTTSSSWTWSSIAYCNVMSDIRFQASWESPNWWFADRTMHHSTSFYTFPLCREDL